MDASGDRGARIREEKAERDRAHPQGEQGTQSQTHSAEQDQDGTRGPDREINRMGDDLDGLLGQACSAEIGGEESGEEGLMGFARLVI